MAAALYQFDGSRFLPGPLTVGPWSADAQHGGPVAALLAGAVESEPAPVPMQVVRMTVELMRPVPLSPLEVVTSVVRPGKRVQLVEASLYAGGSARASAPGGSGTPGGSGAVEVARARALRIRTEAMDVPVDRSGPPAPPPEEPGGFDEEGAKVARRTAFAEAVDLQFVKGSWDDTGPVTMWTRLLVPVVEGRPTSPLQRTAAAADFGNGVSRELDFATHVFINPDLTVGLARVPEGEWIGFDVISRLSPQGFGQAEAQIFDAIGPVGRSVQSLIVSPR